MSFQLNKLFVSRLFFILISVSCLNMTALTANACPTGKPWEIFKIDYMRRDNNRCEGIQDGRNSSNRFELVAFSTSNLNDYPDTLKIIVPGTGKNQPTISIQSYSKNYLLDEVKANYSSLGFVFDLKTKTVLQHRNVKVPFNSLLPLAFIENNSRRVYSPVILDKASDTYKIVIYTTKRRSFPKVEIRQNGKVIPSNLRPRNIPEDGEISFLWQPKNTAPGTYQFYLEDGEGKSLSVSLKHDPKWL